MLADKLITRFHSVLFNDKMEGNEFEWMQILCISNSLSSIVSNLLSGHLRVTERKSMMRMY